MRYIHFIMAIVALTALASMDLLALPGAPSGQVQQFLKSLPGGSAITIEASEDNLQNCQIRAAFDQDLSFQYKDAGADVAANINLKLYVVEREIEGRLYPADVISVLTRDKRVWLRAGPFLDTGWVEIQDLDPEMPAKFPPRACLAKIDLTGSEWSLSKTGEADSLFLAPAVTGGDNKGSVMYQPALSKVSNESLGREAIMTFVASQLEQRAEPSPELLAQLKEPAFPRSSQIVRRRTTRSARNTISAWEQGILPEFRFEIPSERAVSARGASGNEPVSAAEPKPIDNKCGREACGKDCGENQKRILALRARGYDFGFNWSWEGLGDAKVIGSNASTSCCGCFAYDNHGATGISLRNKHLALVDSLQKTVIHKFNPHDPMVFLQAGGGFEEINAGVNAFVSANEGLREFGRLVFDWLPELVTDVNIRQAPEIAGSCAASRQPKSLYLPASCPRVELFVPKGLCRDVVVHELAHEMTGSLVSKSTANLLDTIPSGKVNEAIADFFAFSLREEELFGRSEFAKFCQNDFKDLNSLGLGHGKQNPVVRTLLRRERGLVGKLAVVAVMYFPYLEGNEVSLGEEKLFREMVDFAVYQVGMPHEGFICELCEAIGAKEAIPTCADKCSPPKVAVNAASSPVVVSRQIDLRGEVAQWRGFNSTRQQGKAWFLGVDPLNKGVAFDVSGNPFGSQDVSIATDVTISPDGSIQGWTWSGQQVELQAIEQTSLEPRLGGIPKSLPRPLTSEMNRVSVGDMPRVEIVGHDSAGLEAAFWGGNPELKRFSWIHSIDPESLKVGYDRAGKAVIQVLEKFTGTRNQFSLARDGLREVSGNPIVFTPIDDPGLEFYRVGDESELVTILLEQSICLAPPFWASDGNQLLVMTCDGQIQNIDVNVWPPKVLWRHNLPGALPADLRQNPVQLEDFNGDGKKDWILGPFRQHAESAMVDEIFVLDGGVRTGPSLLAEAGFDKKTVGVPTILKEDGQKCPRLLVSTGDSVEDLDTGSCGTQ